MAVAKTLRAVFLGDPVDPAHQVNALDAYCKLAEIEAQAALNGGLYFSNTLAGLGSIAAPVEGDTAFVLDDITPSNNGVYRRGASVWSRTSDLPAAFSDAVSALADLAVLESSLADVATSGAYASLTGTPTLGTAAAEAVGAFATAAQGVKADTATQPAALADAVLVETNRATAAEESLGTLIDRVALADITRPGEDVSQFSSALTGDPEDRPVITIGSASVTDASGAVWAMDVAGDISPRRAYAIEEGRTYRLRVVIERITDSTDPAGDAVEVSWQNLSKSKAGVSQVVRQSWANPDPKVADGPLEYTCTIGRASGADYQVPATARYGLPLVRTFGNTPVTGVVVFEFHDITGVMAEVVKLESADGVLADADTAMIADIDALQALVDVDDSRTGYSWGVKDAAGRVVGGFGHAAEFILGGARIANVVPGRTGWAWGVKDVIGRLALGIKSDASIWYKGHDVSTVLSARGVAAVAGSETDDSRSGYAWGVKDAAGRVAAGISDAGDLVLGGVRAAKVVLGRSGWAWGVSDPIGQIALGIKDDLSLWYQGRDISAVSTTLASTEAIVCFGDSLTEGAGSTGGQTYPTQLAAITGRTVTQLGRGGQNSAQIAARAGGRAALLTVTGNEIPASGAVTVTALSVDLMSYAGGAWTLAGSLAGVPGTLSEDGGGVYTFTRATTGAATLCVPGTPFVPSVVFPSRIHIIWTGRNDYSGVTDAGALVAVNANIRAAIESIISQMAVVDKRALILGVTSRGDSTAEYIGTENFNAKRDLAADLARDYPKSFIDIDAILRASGDGSATDNVDVANGVLPTSLTAADRLHLNNNGYAIVAAQIAARITQNGW